MKGLGLQRRIFSLGEVSKPTNSKGLLGGEEAFSNEKRQGWKPVSSLERGIDQAQRERALSVNESFIVHAPAGSGKTDLLVKRYLSLLTTVKDPEEIIAITFTKKAAFEMKERILKSLGEESLLPGRLRILTIDALCARLARAMPIESGFGSLPDVSKDPHILYQNAARRLLQDEPWGEPLWVIARHMNNQLAMLETLFADMLNCREQWLETLMSARHFEGDLRRFLEQSVSQVCDEVRRDFLEYVDPLFQAELSLLVDFFLSSQGRSLESDWTWKRIQMLSELCLTKTGSLRKTIDKRSGFGLDFPEMKARMKALLEVLESDQPLVEILQRAQALPSPEYTDQDWVLISALIEVLPLLVSHLQVIFLEKQEVDFSEIALRALHALGESESPTDLALRLDYQIRHILVDEFQDTSPTQFRLIEALVRGWERGDGRTLFLVGDPMQSIYRFRQADVRLFEAALDRGVGQVSLTPLYLSSNFRSSPRLVEFCNQVFCRQATPMKNFVGEIYGVGLQGEGEAEIETILERIRAIQSRYPGDSIAVLGRSRAQVVGILSRLLSEGIPTEAVDMKNLSDVPVIRDLCALLYAFSDEKDRLSWSAFLRSPWVGLSLNELWAFNQIQGSQSDLDCPLALKQLLQDSVIHSPRVSLLLNAYHRVSLQKRDLPVSVWLFNVFEELGGGRGFLRVEEAFAAEQFFQLLGEFSPWETPDQERLLYALSQRFVRAESAECTVQVMTIHKSKGLEFDHVFVPQLHRMSTRDDLSLVMFQERLTEKGWQLLLAPIKSPKGETSSLYRYLYEEEQALADEENIRVLYVASTRAKKTIHFSFSMKKNLDFSDFKPIKGSFLAKLYPFISWDFPESSVAEKETRTLLPSKLYRIPAHREESTHRDICTQHVVQDLNQPEWPDLKTIQDRAVGTLVHRYFSRWVNLKTLPQETDVLQYGPSLVSSLSQLGVIERDLLSASARVQEVLIKTLSSAYREMIFLKSYEDSHAEYRVVRQKGFRSEVYVIDRTFVDEGVRFILDYKVASPSETESWSDFEDRMKATYAPQLQQYSRLLREKGERRPVQLGLFFPLQDRLVFL
jgi:ATP-dependent exoDNAse (exonuclease V) beta subunit